MHITNRSAIAAAAALLSFASLVGCYPQNAHDLGHNLVVHGVVTDSGTGVPLSGVKVTLLSVDNFAPHTTDARGYFQFTDVLQQQNLLVQYELAGYPTTTLTVNPSLLATPSGDAGATGFPGFTGSVDGFDASIALAQQLTVAVAGTVFSGAQVATGAQIALTTIDGTPVFQTKAGADGTFTFAAVPPAKYDLIVLPWDRDSDGLSDTQFFSESLVVQPSTASDLGHLAINLADVQKSLVASSFVDLDTAYPITIADLNNGESGVLQSASGPLFLTFGAEVDPTMSSFELVQFEGGATRFSPPIALTVTWSHGVTASFKPATALQPTSDANLGYELRITSLRFADGTIAFRPAPGAYGTINFTVQAEPTALASPQPSLALAGQFTSTQTATHAIFDANTVWLLDANSDFVFNTITTANWSAANPMQLEWTGVPGAVRYHLFMRNTTSPGSNGAGTLDWQEQGTASIQLPDPNQAQSVVATNVSPWALHLGYTAGPWAFGNHIQFAVTSEDALGFTSSIDPSKILDTGDTFGGLLTTASIDVNASVPFAATTELGDTFVKALQLGFSEPMRTQTTPQLTALANRVSIKKVLASAWANGSGSLGQSFDSATQAFLSVEFNSGGTCTEVTVARSPGDTLIVVRDASYFSAGASSSLVFLSSGGQFVAEAVGLTAVDPTTNRITLTTPLANGISLQQGSLVCALQGATVATVPVAPTTSTLTASSAVQFAVGDLVLFYEPKNGSAAPIVDVSTVVGVDTTTNAVVLSTAPNAGHTTASLLLRMPALGGERALRSASQLAITKDIVGGAGATFTLAAPATQLAVGDTVLVDADGDLKTTNDQAQVKVTALSFAPTAQPLVYSFTADLPATLTLLHGKSKVIALGDAFSVTGTKDSSGNSTLDVHRDQFTSDGELF